MHQANDRLVANALSSILFSPNTRQALYRPVTCRVIRRTWKSMSYLADVKHKSIKLERTESDWGKSIWRPCFTSRNTGLCIEKDSESNSTSDFRQLPERLCAVSNMLSISMVKRYQQWAHIEVLTRTRIRVPLIGHTFRGLTVSILISFDCGLTSIAGARDTTVVLFWCSLVWCGVVWCGVVWCGVVWCGVV